MTYGGAAATDVLQTGWITEVRRRASLDEWPQHFTNRSRQWPPLGECTPFDHIRLRTAANHYIRTLHRDGVLGCRGDDERLEI